MDNSYNNKTWSDAPDSGTALDAAYLNNIEKGIVKAHQRVTTLETTMSLKIGKIDQIFVGSRVINPKSDGSFVLFDKSTFIQYFGRQYDTAYDCISIMNAHWEAGPQYIASAVYCVGDESIYGRFISSASYASTRVNFIVVLGSIDYGDHGVQ